MALPLEIAGYELIDGKTGRVIGSYLPNQRVRATRRADRLDNEYGAYRYRVKTIWRSANDESQERSANSAPGSNSVEDVSRLPRQGGDTRHP